MHSAIISDTSCFILLTKLDDLDLLRHVYGQIITTSEVAAEFGKALPEWIIIRNPSDKERHQKLASQVDPGEASAIALALETPGSIVILDDYRARKLAEQLGLQLTGTLGVIIKAKKEGIIASVKPYLLQIAQTDFRLTEQVAEEVLKQAGEF